MAIKITIGFPLTLSTEESRMSSLRLISNPPLFEWDDLLSSTPTFTNLTPVAPLAWLVDAEKYQANK